MRTSQDDINNSKNSPKFYVVFMNGESIALDFVPSYTVAEVLNLIQNSHDIDYQVLEFKGKPLQLHKSISECGVRESDKLHFRTRSLKMCVIVTKNNQSESLEVESTDTIIRVKEKVQEKFRMDMSCFDLRAGFEMLKDTETLAHYNIQNGSTLQLIVKASGGGGPTFAINFNSLSEEVKLEFGEGPLWRMVDRGLSFRSTCRNPNCLAFNDCIYVNKGFGSFGIAKTSCNLQCPQCTKRAEHSTNCGFYMAKWAFNGMLQNETIKEKSGVADTEQYYTFKEGDNASWIYLDLTVSKLDGD